MPAVRVDVFKIRENASHIFKLQRYRLQKGQTYKVFKLYKDLLFNQYDKFDYKYYNAGRVNENLIEFPFNLLTIFFFHMTGRDIATSLN